MNSGVEQFVPPKNMTDELADMGLAGYNYRACRNLARSMKRAGMPVMRGNAIRPSDAFSFLQANPDWRPFNKANR